MPTPLAYQALSDQSNKTPQRIEGGYSLGPQQVIPPQVGGFPIGLVLYFGWLGIGSLLTLQSLSAQDRLRFLPSVFLYIFLIVFGPAVFYLIRSRLRKKPEILSQSFFAISDWPLEVGQSYGFSFDQPLNDRVLAAGSTMTVVFSYARVTGSSSQVVWQEQHEFPQQAGDTAFRAQWIMTVPAGFAPSRDHGRRWLEWQVAIHLYSVGLAPKILQYKIKVI
jgi:hypothetical protein